MRPICPMSCENRFMRDAHKRDRPNWYFWTRSVLFRGKSEKDSRLTAYLHPVDNSVSAGQFACTSRRRYTHMLLKS